MKFTERIRRIKRNKKSKKRFLILGILLLILSFASHIVFLNIQARKMEIYTDVTFVTPTQALIFWKTRDETLGYVKYGNEKYGKKDIELQTSSEPGEIHVVFLENVPKEGLYIQKINESDSFLIFPPIQYIKYEVENEADE